MFDGEVLNDPGETTYVVSALPAGTYTFICKIAKKYLGRANFMNQIHEKLKQIGATYRSQRT